MDPIAVSFACFNSFAAASSLAFFSAASFSALAFASSGFKIVSAGCDSFSVVVASSA